MARHRSRDRAVRRQLLVKAMLVLSSAALLATSENAKDESKDNDDTLWFTLAGPMARVQLSEAMPSALVRINVRALTLGKYDIQTTEGADINVSVAVTRPRGVTEGVSIRIDSYAGGEPEVLSVQTSLVRSEALLFTGDCWTFDTTNPCVAEATVELAREDGGAGGGIVTVNVTPEFQKTALAGGASEGIALPWTVEVTIE